MKIGALDEVEAWKGGVYLPVGVFDVKCTHEAHVESSKGNPQIELEWEAIEGEHKGASIKDWVVVIPSTLGKVKGLMEACGVDIPKGEFELKPNDFLGLHCRIVVRKEDGDEYPRVRAYTTSDLPMPDTSGMNGTTEDERIPF